MDRGIFRFMKVSDIVLVSDMDGTIIPMTGQVSQKNLDAIARFRDLGGVFTIATGRSPASGQTFIDLFSLDGPMIANNGATIYDPIKNEILWCKYLTPHYKEIVSYVKENFPQVLIELITDDGKYYIASNQTETNVVVRGTDFSYDYIEASDYPDNCCKVLFVPTTEFFHEFVKIMRENNYADIILVESGGNCFEMMAGGITKGYPFEQLVHMYDRNPKNSAAIGDYYNDVEMIEKAGIGAAVANAVPELKKVANVVVKSCDDDGLADFIDYLIDLSNR